MRKVSVELGPRMVRFLPPYPKEVLRPFFSFKPPGYRYMPKYRLGAWDGTVCLLKRDSAPAGLFRAVRKEIEDSVGVVFREVVTKVPVPDGIRPYQRECLEKMEAAAKDGGGLVLNATGTGKTRIAGWYFLHACPNDWACFVVDELTLLKQAKEELEKVLGEEVGEVGDQKFYPRRVTVGTVQTIHKYRDHPKFQWWIRRIRVLVIDEIHLAMNRRNFETAASIQPRVVFGLTATLELQKRHVFVRATALAGPVIHEYPLIRGVAEGYLAPGVVVQVIHWNPCGRSEYQDDYREQVVENTVRNSVIKALVFEGYRRGKCIIVLAERIRHLEILSDLLAKIPHRVVCGLKTVEERVAAKRKFEQGAVRLILANKVFKKGVDIKRVDVILDVAAMKSKNDAIQKFGRGVRMCPGKTGLMYFDIRDEGEKRGQDGENRFHQAARSRARAFKLAKIPLLKIGFESASEMYDQAASFLSKTTRAHT